MVESNHAEERLARVERMLAQCRRESAALKVIAASKVVVVVVDTLDATRAVTRANLNAQTDRSARLCASDRDVT
jgi:hypothetical protein